jgi:signal peptidase I
VRRLLYALASLAVPGLGQAIAGRRRAAYAWLATVIVAAAACALSPWVVLALVPLYLGAAVDAARVAPPPRGSAVDIVAMVVVPIAAATALRAFVVEAFRAPSSSMCPTVDIGDHIFVNKLATPHRGDIVVFRMPCDPDLDYLKRVVGLPGDTVEVRCSVLYVNGEAADLALVDAEASYQDYNDYTGEWRTRDAARYRETLDGRSYELFHDRDAGTDQPSSRDFPHPGRDAPSCTADGGQHVSPSAPSIPSGSLKDVARPGARPCDQQLQFVVPDDQVFVLGDNRDNSNDSRYWGSLPLDYIKGRAVGIWWSRSLSRIGGIR